MFSMSLVRASAISHNVDAERIYAGVILIDRTGAILLQDRDETPNVLNAGRVTTFGGCAEADEYGYEAAMREMREELSLRVAVHDLDLVS